MNAFFDAPALAVFLVVAMLAMLEAGRRIGRRRIADDPAAASGTGVVESAVFALFGLLLAFTFTSAAGRFDQRRALIAQETNAIGTAWLRIDLLPAAAQPPLRAAMRDYLDARLDAWRNVADLDATRAAYDRAERLQASIWSQAVRASAESGSPGVQTLVLGALNETFDLATTRRATAAMHPPDVIPAMLVALSLASALLAGHAMAAALRRPLLHMATFALVVGATVYVIADIEYPRRGLVRVDAADEILRELRRSFD